MEKVYVESVDLGPVLTESVQHRFTSSPVVFGFPIRYESLEATELHPLREVLNCLAFRPASGSKPSLKIAQLLIGHVNLKR